MASLTNPHETEGQRIAASRVNGTAVYDRAGEKLGSVYDLILDKTSGQADYAIMSFGGFLGIGDRYHPLPWKQLRYDTSVGGYVVDLNRAQLEGAPTYEAGDFDSWSGRHGSTIDDYYNGTVGGGDAGLGAAPIR